MLDNLLYAWQSFVKGKRNKKDVQEFQQNLMGNIIDLHNELKNGVYVHGPYKQFKINDPKPRNISKATVRDRLLHHLIYQTLYWYFDRRFIYDSYSCRIGKGTHRAIKKFTQYSRKVSNNYTKQCWVLKCDISRFFDSIDHEVMIEILKKYIRGQDLLSLLKNIIFSFETKSGKGLPLGNLTSQLLVNIYMNEFDQYVRHELKVKYYIRYADDFVFLHQDKKYLQQILKNIDLFLQDRLKLTLHQHKVSIETFSSGIDFLGWVHFPFCRVLRNVTKKRIFQRIMEKEASMETIQSYLGLLSHGNTKKLGDEVSYLCHWSESNRHVLADTAF